MLQEQTVLGLEAIMELQFVWEYLFSGGGEVLPTERTAMESIRPPVVTITYTEHFKEMAPGMVK
jgi:hypothetical protein